MEGVTGEIPRWSGLAERGKMPTFDQVERLPMTKKSLPPANWERLLILMAAISLAALLSSCAQLNPPASEPEPAPAQPVAEKKPPPEPIKPPPRSRLYEWYGSDDYVSHIEISVNEQKARFYSGEKEVGWTTVASGVFKHPTPIGTFAVLEKVQNKRSNIYGRIYNKNGKLVKRNAKMGVDSVPEGGRFKGAPMPFFMRLTNDGIGMHAGPIPRPGHRASHGCIRMPKKFAPVLYRYVDVGTPVTIKGKGPSYTRYLAQQRRSNSKPEGADIAQAAPAATSDAAPAPVTPENSPGAPPPTAPEGVAAVPQSTQTAASLPAATEATTPVHSQMDVSGDAQSTAVSPSAGTADMVDSTPVAPGNSSPTSVPVVDSLPVPAGGPASPAAAVSEATASSPAGSPDPVPAPEAGASAPEGVPIEPPTSLPVEGTMDASLSPEQSQGDQPVQAVPAPSPGAVETGTQSEG